ncbi:MAG: secretin N-terminal domain-containing protein [Candidatus Omnitrophota bacterium]
MDILQFFKGVLVVLLVVFVVSFAMAQEGMPESTREFSPEETDISETTSQPGNVTLIFKDADIRTVLHTLSYKSGINIVAASDVEGKVTIRLVDVPWKVALEVILKNHKLTYEKEGNIIRVTTLESVAEEELQSTVFILNYAKASEVADVISEMLSARGSVKFDERTNSVVVNDIPTNIYKIQTIVARLDQRTPQVSIEAKIIETTLDKDENLGINWTIQATASGSSRPTTFPFKQSDGIISHRPKDGLNEYLPLGSSESDTPFPSYTKPVFPTVDAASFTFGSLNFSQMSAVLEILKSRTDTKIVSNPTVVTLDNQEAKIVVSSVFNIPTYERNDTTGRMEVTGYTEKDIGIILTVTPHVNQAGDIVVDLRPEVSSFIQFDTFGSGDNTIYAPRFSTGQLRQGLWPRIVRLLL